ncbi:hypothetical protein BCR42DRAFT_468949 [Absidia repens]|uniref:G-protein coupled receptors family 2 profile 2 domain-containing protein n=1 Tax=Absidia repens TaxID=90262 RepID=A0A1X2IZJ9_9FUNG|nr:hypothetical protein BCR42DRAFT_468949 [Absidia repens]
MDEGEGELNLSPEQFSQIQWARLACSIISLTINLIAILVFLYLALYHHARVNRPSLRCAAFCCLASFIENLLYIIMISIQGESKFCLAMAFLAQYFAILVVTLLALIGINLVLVYVVNFRRRHILEFIYYPFAIIYSGAGLVGPIVNYYNGNRRKLLYHNPDDTCWYVNVMQNRYGQSLSFMWLYGFIFFSTIIALLSSTIAIIKIVKDNQIMANLFKSRRRLTPSSKLSQVIVRCLLYPLGFLMQCMITIPQYFPGYGLTMASGVLHGLGGVLVALIFLNDPAITYIFSGWYDHWFYKHVIEYVVVETKSNHYVRLLKGNGKITKNTIPGDDGTTVLASFPRNKETLAYIPSSLFCWCGDFMQRQHSLYKSRDSHHDDDNKNNLVLGVDCPEICVISDSSTDTTMDNSSNIEEEDADNKVTRNYSYPACLTKRVPMRRLKLSTSILNQYMESHYFTPDILLRRSFSRNITVEEPVNGYFIVAHENDEDYSYIYTNYSSDLYAKFTRCLLNNCIGRALHRSSNFVIDVNISAEPTESSHNNDPTIISSDPTEEL